jgi:hypothetical protein
VRGVECMCVYSRRSVNLSAYGVPVYDGSSWGTPRGTIEAAGDMLRERVTPGCVSGWTFQKRKYLSVPTLFSYLFVRPNTTFTLKLSLFLDLDERENYYEVFSSASICIALMAPVE